MDLKVAPPLVPEDTVKCLLKDVATDDETDPVWSPGDSQLAFASNREFNITTDYDIWVVNSFELDDPNNLPQNLTNTAGDIPDNYPDWGAQHLP